MTKKQNKPLNKLGKEEKFPQSEEALKNKTKNKPRKPTDKTILNAEIVKPFSLRLGTREGSLLIPLFYSMILEVLARAIR